MPLSGNMPLVWLKEKDAENKMIAVANSVLFFN